ncbi:MAG: hypothetical protein Q8R96_18725 [Bacteroidota bacterium]|nr:hypothetical protein [Bacteroidota bacterium]
MKKSISIITLLLLSFNLLAQDVKPCLFVGLYDSNKKGVCSDRAMLHEDVADFAAYKTKRTDFNAEHQTENPQTYFVAANECIITYEYEKRIAGWGCNAKVIGTKTGKTIEDCNQQLADQLAKYPRDFTTAPNTTFTWQGKGTNTSEFTKDFGGLKGKFRSGNTATKSIILAQFTNQTKDKLATIELSLDGGAVIKVTVNPGSTLTRKYDAKKIEILVEYTDIAAPESSFDIIENTKQKVHEIIINENGKLKPMPSSSGGPGVRG